MTETALTARDIERPAFPPQIASAPLHIEERLLPVVETLMAEHGYSGLNIRDVAKIIGMGSATIYKYFESKYQIALRISYDIDQRIAKILLENNYDENDCKRSWYNLYSTLMSFYDDNHKYAVLHNISLPTNFWFMSAEDWPVTSIRNFLDRLIQMGRNSGHLDPAVTDNHIVAAHFMHVVREVRLWNERGRSWQLRDRIDSFFPVFWKTISKP